jgi:hypothetical protein
MLLKQLQFFTAHLPEQLYIFLQALAIINEIIRFFINIYEVILCNSAAYPCM